MKNSPASLLKKTVVLMAFFTILAVELAAQGQYHALLVAIGDYPQAGGWQKINAPNDLTVIREALEKRGVPAENIRVLKNEQATRAGMLEALQTDLLDRLSPGDVAWFQFSGHGQQVADNNGDEVDGYDEAVVPFDSPLKYQPGLNEGQNLLRDDDLGQFFTRIRQRLGPSGNLVVVLDACHSGTGTRGMELSRGTDVIMASPEYIGSSMGRTSGGGTTFDPFASGAKSGELAPMASFFGSAQNQLNFETRDEQGRGLGSLSYALAKKLTQAPSDMTWRGLFEQVKLEMAVIAPRQQPQAEGTLDQEIMGGNLRENPSFFHVNRWNDNTSVGIDAGWMLGLNEGSVIGFFPPETRDPHRTRPLATGSIRRVLPFESTVELDGSLDEETAKSSWGYLLEQNFGDLKVGVAVNLPQGHPFLAAFQEKIARYPVIETSGQNRELFITPSGNGAEIWSGNDFLLEIERENLRPEIAADRMVKRILAWAQAKFLRQLEAQSEALPVDMEIVPVRLDPRTLKEIARISLDEKRDESGNLHFQVGDQFKIRLTNRGDKTAYFTLIDIQPDNQINILIPGETETPAEFRLVAGESTVLTRPFEIGPPGGTEVFKLVATEQPVDLRPITQSRGAGQKSNQSPFEKMFAETYFNDGILSRGGRTMSLAAGSLNVFSTTFIID